MADGSAPFRNAAMCESDAGDHAIALLLRMRSCVYETVEPTVQYVSRNPRL